MLAGLAGGELLELFLGLQCSHLPHCRCLGKLPVFPPLSVN